MGWLVDLFRMKYLVRDSNSKREERSLGTAYILALPPFGIFGAHHYYLGDTRLGLIYTCTIGIFTLGWIMDLFRMKTLVRKAGQDKKSVGTAYIMAMPPFGMFGAHHYYLGNYILGILYTCTCGIFTIGWIVDLFRMKDLVRASNDPASDYGTTKVTAYVLCVSPLGIFGAHHFYLKRYLNGGFYAATFGLFGFGWIFDMLRLPVLYERYADEDKHKYPDEAYVFWFPFGLFGLHHFYLGRKKWGILYACSFGCLGIGWIIDGIRLPFLIKEFNKYVRDPDMNNFHICRPSCRSCSVNRCRRCCYSLFSCGCLENFSLSSSSTNNKADENGNAGYQPKARDDFEVIKEMYPDENPDFENEALNQKNEGVSTVLNSYDAFPTEQSSGQQTAYDNGAYPGDPGYDEHEFEASCGIADDNQYSTEAETYPNPDNNAYHENYSDTNQTGESYPVDNYNAENYSTENYHADNYDAENYHADNYNAENYQNENNPDDNNYQYNDTCHSNEIRHHDDVRVTVSEGHEQYELENQQNYNQSSNAYDVNNANSADVHM